MPRVKRGTKRRDRRKKILAQAKGYYQRKSKLYHYAKEAVERGRKFAYIGRKLKKRDFRSLWIIRIGAAARLHGLSYSKLMHGLALAEIDINRKMLSEMAIHDPDAFAQIASRARGALEEKGVPLDPAPERPAPPPAAAPAAEAPAAAETPEAGAPAEAAPPAGSGEEAPPAEAAEPQAEAAEPQPEAAEPRPEEAAPTGEAAEAETAGEPEEAAEPKKSGEPSE